METVKQMNRFQFIDSIKGMAILLVVVGHLIQGNFPSESFFLGGGKITLFNWIYMFHMGLFFACSGYLYKWINKNSSIKELIGVLAKKAYRLLIPYLVWGSIMFLYDRCEWRAMDALHYIIIKPHYGLWFLQSLLKYYIFIVLVNYLINKIPRFCNNAETVFFFIVLLVSIICHCTNKLGFLFDWDWCMFLVGLIFRQNERIWKFVNNQTVATIAVAGMILPLFLNVLPKEVVSISALIAFVTIARTNSLPQSIQLQIEELGKNSMPIYLLHFFFVIKICRLDIFTNQIFEFFFLLALAIPIAYCCIMIYRCISFGWIPMLLWGEKNK